MDNKKDYNSFDDSVLNLDEFDGKEVKINPDYYIHVCLLKISNTFDVDNVDMSFEKYRHIVEHVELLCNSSGLLNDNYHEDLKAFVVKWYKDNGLVDGDVLSDDKRREFVGSVSRVKLKLILKDVFKRKTWNPRLKV